MATHGEAASVKLVTDLGLQVVGKLEGCLDRRITELPGNERPEDVFVVEVILTGVEGGDFVGVGTACLTEGSHAAQSETAVADAAEH